MDYKKAGVDIEAGYKSVELMKEHVKKPCARKSWGAWGDSQEHFLSVRSRKWKIRSCYQELTAAGQR